MKHHEFIGIDYSGEGTAATETRKIQVWSARAASPEPQKISGPGKGGKWSRQSVAGWLLEKSRRGEMFLAGIDHAFSLPLFYFEKHGLGSWDEMLEDFVEHWPAHASEKTTRELKEGNPRLEEDHTAFRLTDRWTQSALSVFRWLPGPSVAYATHAGIPWLWWLRKQAGGGLHFWPFDGWDLPGDRPAIVEIYPALYKRRYEGGPAEPDERDAWATAKWLQDVALRGALDRYLMPPLSRGERRRAELEGWILGVG